MLQPAHAAGPATAQTSPDLESIDLPDVDREQLIDAIETLRSELIKRKRILVGSVADKKLDGSDALITAIMPGGLIYAGYKKARYEQARNELARVSADIEDLSDDLIAMQAPSTPVVVAQLP
jgi:hypothetical protein